MNFSRWQPAFAYATVALAVGLVLSHAPFVAGGLLASRLEPGAEGGAMIVTVTIALAFLHFSYIWLVPARLLAGAAAWRASPAPAGLLVLATASVMLAGNTLFGHYDNHMDAEAFTRWVATTNHAARWLSGAPTVVCLAALGNFVLMVLVHPAVGTWTLLRYGLTWRVLAWGGVALLLYALMALMLIVMAAIIVAGVVAIFFLPNN